MTAERRLVRGRLGDAELGEIRRLTATRPCGGVNVFLGVTRPDVVEGRPVAALEYEAYESMADRELARLAAAAVARWTLAWTFVRHSLGTVRAGEIGVVVAAGAAHRDEAYAASRFLIEGIKQEVPIWKRECFAIGAPRWARCGHVPGVHTHARV